MASGIRRQMNGTRKTNHSEWGNKEPERLTWNVLTHDYCFKNL